MMENKKKSPSWGMIILWLFLFWPVSICLIYKRVSNDKAAAMKNSRIFTAIGCFFFFGVIVMASILIGHPEDDTDFAIFGICFYLIGGVLIMRFARKLKRTGEEYRKYIDVVINQERRTLEDVASQMGKNYEQTMQGLQQMIDKGYFTGAFIDTMEHTIVFPSRPQQREMKPDNGREEPQQKIVKCPNCGGNNVVEAGRIHECDYCGSPIK